MKTIIKYLGIAVMLITTFSCTKDDPITVVPDPVQQDPEPEDPTPVATLSSISPTSGPKTTIVSINGNNFGTDQEMVQVFFNEKQATVQTQSNTQITAIVPSKAFSGKVKVVVGEIELIGPKFTYEITDIQLTTLAGGTYGSADGTGENAQFKYPRGITLDADGNLYIADTGSHRIRKVTPSGVVSTLAGTNSGDEDGIASAAKFFNPYDITRDLQGNLYIADNENNKIRKLSVDGIVSTITGGTEGNQDGNLEGARFNDPKSLSIDSLGTLYIGDTGNHSIRKITHGGEVSTIAGFGEGDSEGTGENAGLNNPRGLSLDSNSTIIIADSHNNKIRKITPSGVVSTYAGSTRGLENGGLGLAKFYRPVDTAMDSEGNLYVADAKNHCIRKISADGNVSTIAGSDPEEADGNQSDSEFNYPSGIAIDAQRTIYVVDTYNQRIRKITQE